MSANRLLPLAACLFVGSSALGAQTITTLLLEGDSVAGVGNVTRIDNLAVNDAGQWMVEADTDNVDVDQDSVLLRDGALFLREGQALTQPAGATLDFFDSLTLSPDGASAINLFLDGTSGSSDDSGLFLEANLLIQEGDVSAAPEFTAGTPYIGFFETKYGGSGNVLVMASVDDPAVPSSVDRALVLLTLDLAGNVTAEAVIAKEGDLLPGQVDLLSNMLTGPHSFALNDSDEVLFVATLDGDPSVDHAVYLDSTNLAQEGSPSPVSGRNWDLLSTSRLDLNAGGGYVFSGLLDGDDDTDLLVVKDGQAFQQEGDSLAAFAPFLLTGIGFGPLDLADNGELLWYAEWDDPDTDQNSGLFLDDELIVQEGVTQIGGVVVDTLRGIQDGYALSPNGRYVIFEAVLVDGNEGAFLIDRCPNPAALVSDNPGGSNPSSFTVSGMNADGSPNLGQPVLGGTVTWFVNASGTTGHTSSTVLGYLGGTTATLMGGQVLLLDLGNPAGDLLQFPVAAGDFSLVGLLVPNEYSVCGIPIYTQAVHLFGVQPFALSNRHTFTLGE